MQSGFRRLEGLAEAIGGELVAWVSASAMGHVGGTKLARDEDWQRVETATVAMIRAIDGKA